MNEHSFIRAVHRHLPSSIYAWKINDKFAGGVADAMYAGEASLLWTEYKYCPSLPVRDSTPIKFDLSELQKVWLRRMAGFGQDVAVVLGCEQLAVILTEEEWDTGINKAEFLNRAKPFKEIAEFIRSEVGL